MRKTLVPSILIVDRNRDRCRAARRMLHTVGVFDVLSCSGIARALDRLRTDEIGLVLAADDTDVWGGLEFGRIVARAAQARGCTIPMVLMSAASRVPEERSSPDGIAVELHRPFTETELAAAIDEALK